MQKSESIVELIKALNKAQAAMETAKKGSYNPFKESKYADLTSVWAAIRKPLTDNGLSIIQLPVNDKLSSTEAGTIHGERIGLETTLLHTSGEWISETFFAAKQEKTDPQSIGSLLTYLRRYALSAMIGVCPEDDDAEGAMPQGKQQPTRKTQAKAQPKASQVEGEASPSKLTWDYFYKEAIKRGYGEVGKPDMKAIMAKLEVELISEWTAKFQTMEEAVRAGLEKLSPKESMGMGE